MKIFCHLAFIIAALAISTISVDAQRRTTTRRPAKPKVVTNTNIPATPAAYNATAKAGTEKVAIQIKNVSKFIFALGGIARGIEDLDKDTRANAAAKRANEQNKREVIQAIGNLQAGLAALEVEFRTNDQLKRHLLTIQGITQLSNQARDLAQAGRFSESGKPLLSVVEKLSDTLVVLR